MLPGREALERARAASSMHRLAASIFRVEPAALTAEGYEAVRRIAILSPAAIVSARTLVAGLISSLPDRGGRPSKLARAARALLARWRRRLVISVNVPGPTEFRDRVVVRWQGYDVNRGIKVNPSGEAAYGGDRDRRS